jgi:MFS family permease
MGMATWYVPLSRVLEVHGLGGITGYAFAASALAALASPMIFGAIADRHAPPVSVLRWLAVGTALFTALASVGIEEGWRPGVILALIQIQAILSIPSWSLLNTITFARLRDARRQFGSMRALGTIGWIGGCWLISGLQSDASVRAGYTSGVLWLLLAGFTLFVGDVPPPAIAGKPTIRQRLGLDALSLLANRDHRGVLLTALLISIPLAAFYPYMPPHLRDLGFEHTSAWMSLAQGTEIVAMLGLGSLLGRWRLRSILACGVGFALARYVLCAFDSRLAVLAGVSLHGFAFTLFFVTAPIYLHERVDAAWRARGQALMSLMSQGMGNLLGYLGSGWWFQQCHGPDVMRWSRFWGGLAAAVAVVLAYFLISYRGRRPFPPVAAGVATEPP